MRERERGREGGGRERDRERGREGEREREREREREPVERERQRERERDREGGRVSFKYALLKLGSVRLGLIRTRSRTGIVGRPGSGSGGLPYRTLFPGGLDSRDQSRSRCLDTSRCPFSKCRDFLDCRD